MRRAVLALAAALLSNAAFGADVLPPDVLPPGDNLLDGGGTGRFSWTGAYVGLFGGFAVSDVEVEDADGFNGEAGRSFDYRIDGFYLGGLAGYNYEMGLLVFGAEGELATLDLDDSERDPEGNGGVAGIETDLYAAVTGRVGLSIDRFLGYAKGGVAFADFEASFRDDALTGESDEQEWLTGWTVGAGVEMAVNPNFSLRGEYTFTEFDDPLSNTASDELGQEFEVEQELDGLHLGKFIASYRF